MKPKEALRSQHLVEPDAIDPHRVHPAYRRIPATPASLLSPLHPMSRERVIGHHLACPYLSAMVDLPVDDAAVAGAACAVTGEHLGHLLLGKLGAEPSGEVVLVGARLVAEGGHVEQIRSGLPLENSQARLLGRTEVLVVATDALSRRPEEG